MRNRGKANIRRGWKTSKGPRPACFYPVVPVNPCSLTVGRVAVQRWPLRVGGGVDVLSIVTSRVAIR